MIKVSFRKFEDDQIIALFIRLKEGKDMILSYMEIGQHSPAHVDLLKDLNTCSSKETLTGVKMLHDAGYTHLIIKR